MAKSATSIHAKRVDIVSCKLVKESPSIQYTNRRIGSPDDVVSIARLFLEDNDRETVLAIYLDRKNQPTAIHTVSIGSVCSSIVHPREVFKAALLSNSSSMILVHNHPSGDPTPSAEDIRITKTLIEAGKILDIEFLDHIVIGNDGSFCSLKALKIA